MSRPLRFAAAAGALLAVLVGIPTGPTAAQADTAAPIVLTTGQANAAVFDWADVPTSWRPLWDPTNPPTASETGGACNGPNSLSRAQQAGATATAGAGWAKSATKGPGVSEWIYEFPDVAHATTFMEASRQALARCPKWTATTENGDRFTTTGKFARATVPAGADDAYRIAVTNVRTRHGRVIFRGVSDELHIRQANHVYVVTNFGAERDLAGLERYRAVASTKLAQVLRVAPTLAPNQSYATVDELRIAFVSAGGSCPGGRTRRVVHARGAMDCSDDTVLILYDTTATRDANVAQLQGGPLLVGPNWVLNTTLETATVVQGGMGGEIRSSPSG